MRNYFSGKDPNVATIRLRVPIGIVYPEQLDILKEAALRYGDGRLHLTVRKTIEIPGVPRKDLGLALALLSEAGWYSGAFGNNVRNIVACPGKYSCPQAQIDTQALGLELDSAFASLDHLPNKIKISISGCPNGCTAPLSNDIGIIGVAKIKILEEKCVHCSSCIKHCRENALSMSAQGQVLIDYGKCIDCGECVSYCPSQAMICEETYYRLFIGGKMGRHPRFGQFYGDFSTVLDLLYQVEKILAVYYRHGKKDERIGDLIERISLERFRQYVSEWEADQELSCLPLERTARNRFA